MKEQDAIEYFKKMKEERTETLEYYTIKDNHKFMTESKKQIEICDTVIQTLEKQIPKKVFYNRNTGIYVCPICKSKTVAMPYCFKCGQRLEE
jgi:hypothetical protein